MLAAVAALRQHWGMTPRQPPSQDGPDLDRNHRAEIVDRLYDVALDPIRLQDLLDLWESRMGPLRESGEADRMAGEIAADLQRATVFLDRFEVTRADGGYRSILDEIGRLAAFVADGGPGITGFNRPAALAFGLSEGARLADLPFEAEDVDLLRAAIARVAGGREEKVVTLRLRAPHREGPVLMRVGPLASAEARPLALVVSTELVWPEEFALTVQEAFGLTPAEVEIVRAITMGQPIKHIAEARHRSAETVRTQVRSILAKTETHSQSELVRVVLGLMDVAVLPSDGAVPLPRQGTLDPVAQHRITVPGGRRLGWIEFGAAQGAPCLVIHTDYGLIRWPAAAEAAADRMGMRVIVPVRAGYWGSDAFAPGTDPLQGPVADYLAVLDHLRLERVAVLVMGSGLRYAVELARARPGLVTGILGTACQLPLQTTAQLERMDKWQRFTVANARHAPKILPFVVKAGFSLAQRMGKEAYFAQANGGSPADMATFARPEVREALLEGSEVLLGPAGMADAAYTRECIGAAQDWSALLRQLPVPVRLMQGEQDPMTPAQTVRELLPLFPGIEASFLPEAGQLLFFAHWPQVLQALGQFLPSR